MWLDEFNQLIVHELLIVLKNATSILVNAINKYKCVSLL